MYQTTWCRCKRGVLLSIEAFLRGKLPEIRNWEDYLTSCVFELLKYLPIQRIKEFINRAPINLEKCRLDLKFEAIEYYFWPNFPLSKYCKCSNTKPDLVIVVDDIALIIETKFYSSKSGIGIREITTDIDDPNIKQEKRIEILDQLAREYLVGKELVIGHFKNVIPQKISDFYILYLTIDSILPEDDINDSFRALQMYYDNNKFDKNPVKAKFYWLNWQSIANFMVGIRKYGADWEQRIAESLYTLLKEIDLIPFEGFIFLDDFSSFPLNICIEPIYYYVNPYFSSVSIMTELVDFKTLPYIFYLNND